MIFFILYTLIGLVSYYPCARMDNIDFDVEPQYVFVAALIWTFAWLPILLARLASR